MVSSDLVMFRRSGQSSISAIFSSTRVRRGFSSPRQWGITCGRMGWQCGAGRQIGWARLLMAGEGFSTRKVGWGLCSGVGGGWGGGWGMRQGVGMNLGLGVWRGLGQGGWQLLRECVGCEEWTVKPGLGLSFSTQVNSFSSISSQVSNSMMMSLWSMFLLHSSNSLSGFSTRFSLSLRQVQKREMMWFISSSKYFLTWVSEGLGYLNLAEHQKVPLMSSMTWGFLAQRMKASMLLQDYGVLAGGDFLWGWQLGTVGFEVGRWMGRKVGEVWQGVGGVLLFLGGCVKYQNYRRMMIKFHYLSPEDTSASTISQQSYGSPIRSGKKSFFGSPTTATHTLAKSRLLTLHCITPTSKPAVRRSRSQSVRRSPSPMRSGSDYAGVDGLGGDLEQLRRMLMVEEAEERRLRAVRVENGREYAESLLEMESECWRVRKQCWQTEEELRQLRMMVSQVE